MNNTKKAKNVVNVDPLKKTITLSKAYYKKACIYGTPEYHEFREILKDNEGFKINFSVIEKKTYRDLTIARMEEYIATQPNSEKQLIAFKAVQRIAEKKGSKYPLSKKWFLKNYPEYKQNDVSASEISELEKQLEAELDELNDDDDTLVDFPSAVNM